MRGGMGERRQPWHSTSAQGLVPLGARAGGGGLPTCLLLCMCTAHVPAAYLPTSTLQLPMCTACVPATFCTSHVPLPLTCPLPPLCAPAEQQPIPSFTGADAGAPPAPICTRRRTRAPAPQLHPRQLPPPAAPPPPSRRHAATAPAGPGSAAGQQQPHIVEPQPGSCTPAAPPAPAAVPGGPPAVHPPTSGKAAAHGLRPSGRHVRRGGRAGQRAC